ncbi:Uncharacterised protein [uncultured archaeon]|nr:Uncharacterised protein [uncultured archaeon]
MNFFVRHKWFLVLLALVNFAAGIYSFSFYAPQLEINSPLLWFFIADCPIYAIIFGLTVLLIAKERPSPLLSFISLVGSIKYGLWTIFVLGISNTASLYPLIILAHLLLLVETIVLFRVFSFKVKHVLIALVWFVINDYLDYTVGLHPYVPDGFLSQAGTFAIICSLILPFVLSIVFSARNGVSHSTASAPKAERKKKWAH